MLSKLQLKETNGFVFYKYFLYKKNQTLSPISSTIRLKSDVYAPRVAHNFDPDPTKPTMKDKTVNVTFIDLEGTRHTVGAIIGETLLQVAERHNLKLRPSKKCMGLGVPACSRCHVILSDDSIPKVPQSTVDEDERLFDTEFSTPNSRLACQITIDEDCEGLVVSIAQQTSGSKIDDWVSNRN
jgi:2Fe-2S ferredoxin